MNIDLSRRSFLKLAGAGAAATSLGAMGFEAAEAATAAHVRAFKLATATETRNVCTYCSVACGILMYSRGDLAAGEATAVELEVEVTELPEAGTAIPNVATVAAAEPDPDCDDGHPEALCNADDEDTPRAEDPAVTTTTATPTTAAPTHPSADAPPPDPGTIVRTGIDVSLLVGIAIAALGVGIAALAIRRRRRRDYEFW